MATETEVYKAINAVTAELAKVGVSKNQKNKGQGWSFRGIDDVYNVLAGLLAKHGLCIFPRVVTANREKIPSQKGGTLFYTYLEVEYDLVSSSDGSMHTAKITGEAMDSGDKSNSKALSNAYKYLCFEVFCIPVKGEPDADADDYSDHFKDGNGAKKNYDSLLTTERSADALCKGIIDIANKDGVKGAEAYKKQFEGEYMNETNFDLVESLMEDIRKL